MLVARAVVLVAWLCAALAPEQVAAVRARYKEGTGLVRQGRYEDGAAIFKSILRAHASELSHPARVRLYYAVGFCYLRAHQPLRAQRAVKLCLALAPESPKVKQLAADLEHALETDDEDLAPPSPSPSPAATPSEAPTPAPSPTALPPPGAAEAKMAFQEGEALHAQVLALIDATGDFDRPLGEALAKLDVARRGDHRKARTLFLMGTLLLRRADPGDAAEAVRWLEESAKLEPDAITLMELGSAYGLVPDVEKEIAALERAIELDPNLAEAHFRAAIAYDRSKRKDAARMTFEHAKAAIKLKPDKYKLRFQNMLRNSDVAAKIATVVQDIIGQSERDELTEDKINAYAKQFEEMLGPGAPPEKVEEFKRLLKDRNVQKLLDKLPPAERERILKEKEPQKILELLLRSGLTPQR